MEKEVSHHVGVYVEPEWLDVAEELKAVQFWTIARTTLELHYPHLIEDFYECILFASSWLLFPVCDYQTAENSLILGNLNARHVGAFSIDLVFFRLLIAVIGLVKHVHAERVHLVVHGHQIDSLWLWIIVKEAEGHEAALDIVEANVHL